MFIRMMKYKDKKIDFAIVYMCMLIGAIARVVYCMRYPVPVRDAYLYESFISQWINDGVFPNDLPTPPLSIFFLKIACQNVGYDIIKVGTVLNVLISLITIGVIIKKLLSAINSKAYAFLIGVLIATHPSLIYYSCQLLRESFFLFFFSIAVIMMSNYFLAKHKTIDVILSSLFSGATILCRYEGMELCIIFIILALTKKNSQKIKDLTLYCFVLLISICIIELLTTKQISFFSKAKTEFYDMHL